MKLILKNTRVLSLCAIIVSCLGFAKPIDPQPGENIWHLAASIGTEVDQFAISQSACCAETNTSLFAISSKIDLLGTQGCDLSGTLTVLNEILNIQEATESIIDNITTIVVADFAGTFTVIAALNGNGFSGTYTALNALINQEIQTQSNLDSCCLTISSKLDILALIDSSCTSSALSQSNVSAGVLTLTTTGQRYCLTQNITASVSITAPDITLDLNDYTLNGVIAITLPATRTIVENGKIIPTTPPTSNLLATNGTVQVQASGAQLLNLQIQCPTSTGATGNNGLNGLTGIRIENVNTIIRNCSIISGNAASGLSALQGGIGGIGGIGIDMLAGSDNTQIMECQVLSGNGGVGGTTTGFNSTPSTVGAGGASGNGINVIGNNVLIFQSIIRTGNGGNGANAAASTGAAGNGGNSGNGINSSLTTNIGLIIRQCQVTTGLAGSSGSNLGFGLLATSGSSGIAINNTISYSIIDTCFLTTGSGAQGGSGSGTSSIGGVGGASGIGINNIATQNVSITNNMIVTGTGGNGGFGETNAVQGTGGVSGAGILNSALNTLIDTNVIAVSRGGTGSTNPATTASAGNGALSGNGISNSGSTTQITRNTVLVNNGGNGGASSSTFTGGTGAAAGSGISNTAASVSIGKNIINVLNGGNGGSNLNTGAGSGGIGGNGGIAISTSGNNVVISYNNVKSGNGGNGGNVATSFGTGAAAGAGGSAIVFNSGDGAAALNNTIEKTGNGGNGGSGLTQGARGAGGHGIFIGTAPTHTQVGINTISNTGVAGTGTGGAVGGFAINDTATTAATNASIIYSNLAYNMANPLTNAYIISVNSVPTSGLTSCISTSTVYLDNVYTCTA